MTDSVAKPIAGPEDAEPGALLEARRILLKRLDEPGQDSASTLALLAEVQYWLGTTSGDGQKETHLADGVEYGKRAAALAPGSVAANFWYTNCMVSLGSLAGEVGWRDFCEAILLHGNRALELDESYRDAGPLRVMARFYCTAPVEPVGPGDRKKALEFAKRAVELEPGHLHNRIVLAEAYLCARYFKESRRLLREILSAPEPEDIRLGHGMYRAEAQRILERLERME